MSRDEESRPHPYLGVRNLKRYGPEIVDTGVRLEVSSWIDGVGERILRRIPIVHEASSAYADTRSINNAGLYLMAGYTSSKDDKRGVDGERFVVAGNVRAAPPTTGELERRIAVPVEMPDGEVWTVSKGEEQPGRPRLDDYGVSTLFWGVFAYDRSVVRPVSEIDRHRIADVLASGVRVRGVYSPERARLEEDLRTRSARGSSGTADLGLVSQNVS